MKNQFNTEQSGKISAKYNIVKSFAAKLNKQRSVGERIADFLTTLFGNLPFAILHVIWFIVWLVWNLNLVSWLKPFDPYPFGLLTTIVSLEAIFLAIFVLVSQNRASKVDQLRSEVDLQVDLATEQEITKILQLLKIFLEKSGVDLDKDEELKRMLKPIDEWRVEKKLEKQLDQPNK